VQVREPSHQPTDEHCQLADATARHKSYEATDRDMPRFPHGLPSGHRALDVGIRRRQPRLPRSGRSSPALQATGSPPAVDLRQELTPPLGREVQRPRTQNDLRAVPGLLHLCLWAFTIPKFVSDGDRRCGWTAERYDRTTQIAARTMRTGAGDCRRWRFGRSIAPGSSTQRLGPPPSAHLA
jgi:hypothetical protein